MIREVRQSDLTVGRPWRVFARAASGEAVGIPNREAIKGLALKEGGVRGARKDSRLQKGLIFLIETIV